MDSKLRGRADSTISNVPVWLCKGKKMNDFSALYRKLKVHASKKEEEEEKIYIYIRPKVEHLTFASLFYFLICLQV